MVVTTLTTNSFKACIYNSIQSRCTYDGNNRYALNTRCSNGCAAYDDGHLETPKIR